MLTRCHSLLQGLRNGSRERINVRPQAMLEGKDLPANNLSNLLEQKVNAALAADRQQRAVMQGKPLDQVPTAEGLTVRVINNVIKKCEVRCVSGWLVGRSVGWLTCSQPCLLCVGFCAVRGDDVSVGLLTYLHSK